MDNLTANDLIFTIDENNNINSGGYKINSYMLENNISPLFNTNDNVIHSGGSGASDSPGGSCGSIFSQFDNLAVPAGLLFLQHNINENSLDSITNQQNTIITDSLHDRLLGFHNKIKPKKYTKSNKPKNTKKNKKTKRLKKLKN